MYAIIDGGVPPVGKVRVSGAKNSATRLLAAALLTDAEVELDNFPTRLVDVGHKIGFARDIGTRISVDDAATSGSAEAGKCLSSENCNNKEG